MNRVLVTGAAGFIGSHVVRTLRSKGYEVIAYDDLSTGRRDAVPATVEFHLARVGDLRSLDAVMSSGIAAVLHFAGSVSVPESMALPLAYYRNNTVETLELIESCCRHRIGCLLFSSTAAVYGNAEQGSAVKEDALIAPLNPYGASKAMSERAISDAAKACPLRFGVLRYFNVAGADPEGAVGPQSAERVPNLINNLCAALLSESGRFTVFGTDYPTPDGACVRDFIHVSDLAEAHVLVLEHLLGGGESVTLNCGYGRGHSVLDVIRAGEAVAGRKLEVQFAPRRPGDPASVVADVSRLRSTLAWEPQFDDLELMVRHSYQWHARQRGRHAA